MAKGRLLEQIMTFYVALKEYKKEWLKEKIHKEQEGKKRKRRKGGKEGEGRGMEGRETVTAGGRWREADFATSKYPSLA